MRISDWSSDVCSSDLWPFSHLSLNIRVHPTKGSCLTVRQLLYEAIYPTIEGVAHRWIVQKNADAIRLSRGCLSRAEVSVVRVWTSVGEGKRVSVRVVPGGSGLLKKNR